MAQEYAAQGKKERGADSSLHRQDDGTEFATSDAADPASTGRTGVVRGSQYRRRRFPVKYSRQDMAVLAGVDRAHEWLSGPATVRILKREYEQFGKAEYARLAEISVAHLYNLRRSVGIGSRRRSGSRRGPARSRSASGASPTRKDGRAFLQWTRCIKATGTASKGCITSMRWTR